MRRRRDFTTLTALLAVLTLFAAACSSGEPDDDVAATGGPTEDQSLVADDGPWTLRMGVGADIPNLDAHNSQTDWVKLVHYGNVSEQLVQKDENGDVAPLLAESWEMVDPQTVRFHLVRDATFHNGEPFDADAVLYNFERIFDEDVVVRVRGYLGGLDRFEKVDDYTVDMHSDGPAELLMQPLTYFPMVPPDYAESDPDALNQMGVGTGPYTMAERTAERVVLEKNTDYWGGEVGGPDTVILQPMPEPLARVSALEAGDIDLVDSVPTHLAERLPVVHARPGFKTIMLYMNAYNGPTQDRLVREAIVNAIDAEGIRASLFGEGDTFAQGLGCQWARHDRFIGYHPDLTNPQPYDPERASELIAEAGAAGETVRIAAPIGLYPGGEDAAVLIAEQLRTVGLAAEAVVEDNASWQETIFQPREERVEVTFVGADTDTSSVTQPWGIYLQSDAPLESFPHDEHPELQETMDAARSELDAERRGELFREVAQTACDSHNFKWLYVPSLVYGHSEDITMPERFANEVRWADLERAA